MTTRGATTAAPVIGCCVIHADLELYPETRGLVAAIDEGASGAISVQVRWGSAGVSEWHPLRDLRNGFREGHEVQDSPRSNTLKTLGPGTVLGTRELAGHEQALVQLHSTGETFWLPYRNLRLISRSAPSSDSTERFRLKTLACALDSWNRFTGALDRFDVDPLPHQIDLVHRIMDSGQKSWLIADDVGLGKTIEVGLMLAAKKRRREARRVLVVCPAGMVQQWKDEMQDKFNEHFLIYGQDFHIASSSGWAAYNFDKVIVSIDRAKSGRHLPLFTDSEPESWDVIIFDEAHHLSKISGEAVTQRYQLAEKLRPLTDEFIFLTGTPHQGNRDRFFHLLRLLRPGLTRRLSTMFSDPSVVAEIVLRNRKSQVTDVHGNFLFSGQDTHRIEVPFSKAARDFDDELQSYLRHGYDAAAVGGNTGRVIGFVMTTYRKLASSSIAAIEKALRRRLARLQGVSVDDIRIPFDDSLEHAFLEGTDSLDNLDDIADVAAAPFFDDEQLQIGRLLTAAETVKAADRKLEQFLTEIVAPLQNEGQKLLVFTEYRATQDYLVKELTERYPDSGVAQIHGDMDLDEKRHNIDLFNESAQFMVSTEAGGEGFNLHENCHILVNYDLPWNPARLVQRAGRLYRYGQSQRVVVFNLLANDGFDNMALGKMLDRVDKIAADMAAVGTEFREGLHDEIVGGLLERVDVASILAAGQDLDIDRTDDEITEAIERARAARAQQEELFAQVAGFDPQSYAALTSFGPDSVLAFLEGILPFRNIRIRERLYNGQVLELVLPGEMIGRFSEFGNRTVVRVTASRAMEIRRSRPAAVPMDFASEFFTHLINFAQSREFKGELATLVGSEPGVLRIYKLRWQNDQGVPNEEQLLPVFLGNGRRQCISSPQFFADLVSNPAVSGQPAEHTESRREIEQLMSQRASDELSARCTDLRHPNDIVLLAEANITGV